MTLRAQWDRTLAFALLLAGAVAVAVGWVGVSGASTTWAQVSYLVSGGLVGLLCLGIGMTLLLSAGLRDEFDKLAELAATVPDTASPPPSRATAGTAPLLVAGGVAVALVAAGWNTASLASDHAGAVPGVTLGVAGLLLVAIVSAGSLVRLRVRLQAAKATVLPAVAVRWPDRRGLLAAPSNGKVVDVAGLEAADAPAARGEVLVAPGLTRYHQPGCPTLAELTPTAVPLSEADPGLRPCRICEVPR